MCVKTVCHYTNRYQDVLYFGFKVKVQVGVCCPMSVTKELNSRASTQWAAKSFCSQHCNNTASWKNESEKRTGIDVEVFIAILK